MATVFSPNVIEIVINMQHSGKPTANVWHMWFDPELGTDTMEDVVLDFANNWQDEMLDMVCSNVQLLGFDWRSLDPSDSTVGFLAPDTAKPVTGLVAENSMPPNVAYLVKKNTENRPRGRRDGRSFLPGVSEERVGADGVIAGPSVLAFQADLNDFYNGISDTSGSAAGDRYPCVLQTTPASRAPGSASVTIASRRVTSLTLDPIVSTQRDRLR